MEMERVILHCDCNSFFASVETALNPSYIGVPMAVCGNTEDRHGIVLAKNEEAKKYGIQTADTVFSALKLCPGLVIAEPHYSEYARYSKAVNEIYNNYTDLVEPFGIDESWLDVTASRRIFGSGEAIANEIKERIKKELHITVSVGVSFNKVFAKLGSDYKKPDAVTVISKENFKNVVYPLPVGDLLFVGKRTARELNSIGARTIGDLASLSRELLIGKFGKMGNMLYLYARGLDDSPVSPVSEEAKSISNGYTFKKDIYTREQSKYAIDYLCEEIGTKLRLKRLKCTTVSLTVKDTLLRSIQRQRHLKRPTDISTEISSLAYEILCDEWQFKLPVRMLTVSVSGFFEESGEQFEFDFSDSSESADRDKIRKKEETMDKIRQKFGVDSIVKGSVIDSDLGIGKK